MSVINQLFEMLANQNERHAETRASSIKWVTYWEVPEVELKGECRDSKTGEMLREEYNQTNKQTTSPVSNKPRSLTRARWRSRVLSKGIASQTRDPESLVARRQKAWLRAIIKHSSSQPNRHRSQAGKQHKSPRLRRTAGDTKKKNLSWGRKCDKKWKRTDKITSKIKSKPSCSFGLMWRRWRLTSRNTSGRRAPPVVAILRSRINIAIDSWTSYVYIISLVDFPS